MNRISDYALLGDCHSAALVGRDGSIDWACFPRFDSPAVFAAALDPTRGGCWSITVAGSVRRAYLPGTNVLVTTFETPTGALEVTDCMPVEAGSTDARRVVSHASLLRRFRCVAGVVQVETAIAPRFEYGAFVPRFHQTGPTLAEIVGGADALFVRSTHALRANDVAIVGSWTLSAGDEAWIDTSWRRSYEVGPEALVGAAFAQEAARRLEATITFWTSWLGRCRYQGLHRDAVLRSALALKAMIYAPSGAIVAAPSASLPEEIGGERNWDYRFTWIRDANLALTSLFVLGFMDEAAAFKSWLERVGAGRPEDLQIMYGVGGERWLPELQLPDLSGHRGSSPVRIGNGAVKQLQLDVYGQLFESAWLYHKAGGELTPANGRFLALLADVVCRRWQQPDQGIWEIRDAPRHFTHSKAWCWMALHRAVQLAPLCGTPREAATWAVERDRIRDFVLQQAAPTGWLHQAAGHAVPDASTLLVAALGMISPKHPVALATVEAVRRSLEQHGLLRRYMAPDGVRGGEGAFLLCSFWLVDQLTHSGRLDEAEALLERLVGCANDVGLLSEEVDASTGELLGNFPQAFSHMALVTSAEHLTAARAGRVPEGAHDFSELAVDRLVASRALRP